MGFISLQLGILNLLPVPVLDGGHVFILLTEGLLRRDLSMRLKEKLNYAGFIALVALMVAVVCQDILKRL
jgi:regulator of sigma E protease